MSQFQLGAPSSTISPSSTPARRDSSDLSDDDIDTLPYPAELSRDDFLQQNFEPQEYLSTLRNRHQTLEDLRSDLRQRSQLLNKELLDLVNGNYEEFLSLGSDLKGGEEKIEGVRVGTLGFEREVEGIRKAVVERRDEVRELLGEKKQIRRDVMLGRNLLEVHERITELEHSLGISEGADDLDEEDDEDEDEDEEEKSDDEGSKDGSALIPLRRLRRHAQQYLLIMNLIERLGPEHPFLLEQKGRLDEARKTMLLDLAAALRQAKTSNLADSILAVTKIYAALDAEAESVKVLRGG
jgi:hypothetical protein